MVNRAIKDLLRSSMELLRSSMELLRSSATRHAIIVVKLDTLSATVSLSKDSKSAETLTIKVNPIYANIPDHK